MNYKLFIYIISLFASIFALSGINFDGFIKTNKARTITRILKIR